MMEDRYGYDSLNRLASVHEYSNGVTLTGNQQYEYDRWGNRTIKPITLGANKQSTINTVTNQLGVPNSQPGQMAYDRAGNLTCDTYTGVGDSICNADNCITATQDSLGWSYYTYNANSQRIRLKINNQKTWLLAGFDSSGGAHVQWFVTDHLGTTRMIIDQPGSVANIKRHDYLPFGEELWADTSGCTSLMGYVATDGVIQKFTSKERDVETSLGLFLARYYISSQESLAVLIIYLELLYPRTWNRYAYARISPFTSIEHMV